MISVDFGPDSQYESGEGEKGVKDDTKVVSPRYKEDGTTVSDREAGREEGRRNKLHFRYD